MNICGLQKLAMVDFPGKIAATVFTGACNLRCPFCHNALLVTRLTETPTIPTEEVLDFLRSRRGLLDGVVLSGGEPLLQSDAVDFLQSVRDMGFAVKLDTNGCYPDALADILSHRLVDYIAMDIKNCREKYGITTGVPNLDLSPILSSIDLIQRAGIDYEFRTTVVRELHTAADIQSIGKWLSGSHRYVLQQFVDSGNLISSAPYSAYSPEELHQMADHLRPLFGEVLIRGVE